MIAQKPKPINFQKLKTDLQNCIGNLENLSDLLKQDIERLENKAELSNDEKKELCFYKDELFTVNNRLDANRLLVNEYELRCNEEEEREKAEKKDYITCSFQILKKAHDLKENKRVPIELRNHLKQVLSQQTGSFNLDQKIAFHLALKKEVELCNNSLK